MIAPPMLRWVRFLAALIALASCLSLNQYTSATSKFPSKLYELKFQSEIDNSSISKREGEQQIFKCQVRLAPITSGSALSLVATRPRLKSRQFTLSPELLAKQPADIQWPANVSLAIEWLRDDQQLVGVLSEPVNVLNVELKNSSSISSSQLQIQHQQKAIDKKQAIKPRVEIKNTSNGSQIKLTSRLRLINLKAIDSGRYRCLAIASFRTISANNSTELVHVEQSLESNGAKLIVSGRSDLNINRTVQLDHRQPTNTSLEHMKARLNVSALSHEGSHSLQMANTVGQTGGQILTAATLSASISDFLMPLGTKDRSTQAAAVEKQHPHPVSQFEDDEDLFKLDPDRIEFVSGQPLDSQNGALPAFANDDEQNTLLHSEDDRKPLTSPSMLNEWAVHSVDSPSLENDNESSWLQVALDNQQQQQQQQQQQHHHHHHRHRQQSTLDDLTQTNYYASKHNNINNDDYLHSTRLKLVKLVHKIAPELSCYTGRGEHYRGNVSTSADGRPCLNWTHFTRFSASFSQQFAEDNNHNYCRNPNIDPSGPWCFVRIFEHQLNTVYSKDGAQNNNNNNRFAGSSRILQWPCAIRPCSEYMWLYIIAPPIGLLIVLSCGLVILVRLIRRSHYNSVFSASGGKVRVLPKLNKLIRSRNTFAPKQLVNAASKKSCPNYLDDEIFEIADDLDWSDGQQTQHSTSPRSAESLKLNSSFSNSTTTNEITQLTGCKSMNQPIFSEKALEKATKKHSSAAAAASITTGPTRSSTQVGPMFATLRCHIRGSLKPKSISFNQNGANKSSTFIEQADSAACKRYASPDWPVSPNSTTTDSTSTIPDSPAGIHNELTSVRNEISQSSGSHLISCSSTTENMNDPADDKTTYIRACELPQFSASSVVIVSDQQPLFEGKFSQVQMAIVKHYHDTNPVARSILPSAHIGAQVAIYSLKANSAIDPATFRPSTIRLHNLNHLNLLKLIGYVQINDEIGLKQSSTSLIYDMAQLVDLSDWLKQQAKDVLTSSCAQSNDLGIKRNLTCIAKQTALALDYLHDQGIIYRDLACRNCFLDPTKMLVKLSSFNSELVVPNSDSVYQNLKSLIRPKFLLDYYVIDSRPSDCQLLPLSWIPLESILFNKFNKQTDVWSFGCLIYELFSLGEVAHFGYSSKQIIDTVRSNLMPPQPLLCPSGIYRLMCKCLSDIPIIRPDVKQIYEQLNLYTGQCSSFLDHHLCSLATSISDDQVISVEGGQIIELNCKSASYHTNSNSISKTKSYANIKNYSPPTEGRFLNGVSSPSGYDNLAHLALDSVKPEGTKLPMSKSINLGASRLVPSTNQSSSHQLLDKNHYDEPIVEKREMRRTEN